MAATITSEKELSQAELRVWQAAQSGERVDFQVGDKEIDLPKNGLAWSTARTVRAALLGQILTGAGLATRIPIRAVSVRGARITGKLDLDAADLPCPLTLADCYLDEAIALNQASAVEISLSGSVLPALYAQQLATRGDLELSDGFSVDGGVDLLGAHIGGQLIGTAGRFSNADGPAISADSLTVDQDMYCDDAFVATGEVQLVGAHIKGQLQCKGGQFNNPAGAALNADQMTVDGGMFCDEFVANGEVRLVGAQIGNVLSCTGSRITSSSGLALSLDRLNATGHVFLDERFTASGEVRLIGAHVKGQLICSGGQFTNSHGPALSGDGATIGEDVFCDNGFRARGGVGLLGAHIGGQLNCSGGRFSNPRGHAIDADGLTVDQDMYCDMGFIATGAVQLVGAHIGGQFNCSGGRFINSRGSAIEAAGLTVLQEMFCDQGFVAHGELGLVRAHITQLDCGGGQFVNPKGSALDLEAIEADELLIRPLKLSGVLDLTDARVHLYKDDFKTWPETLRLKGFTYDSIESPDSVNVTDRLVWVTRNDSGYVPQIYDQLAAAYRRAGLDADAQRVAIAKQRRRRAKLNLPGKVWNVVLEWVVGYGYRTWQAGIWLVGLLVIGTVVFGALYPAHLSPLHKAPEQPEFQPILYTLDLLLPVINLHQRDAWTAHDISQWLVLAFSLAGWILTTAIVVSLSGILKRE